MMRFWFRRAHLVLRLWLRHIPMTEADPIRDVLDRVAALEARARFIQGP